MDTALELPMELTGEQRALKARCKTVGRVLRFFSAQYAILTALGISACVLLLVVKGADSFVIESTQDGLRAAYQAKAGTFLAGASFSLPASLAIHRAQAHAKAVFALAAVNASAGDLLLVAALASLRHIFVEIDQAGTPFCARCVACIRRIGWIGLAASLLKSAVYPVLLLILTGSGTVQLVNLRELLFCGMIFCLAEVFAYGASLQRQADETL